MCERKTSNPVQKARLGLVVVSARPEWYRLPNDYKEQGIEDDEQGVWLSATDCDEARLLHENNTGIGRTGEERNHMQIRRDDSTDIQRILSTRIRESQQVGDGEGERGVEDRVDTVHIGNSEQKQSIKISLRCRKYQRRVQLHDWIKKEFGGWLPVGTRIEFGLRNSGCESSDIRRSVLVTRSDTNKEAVERCLSIYGGLLYTPSDVEVRAVDGGDCENTQSKNGARRKKINAEGRSGIARDAARNRRR